MTLLKNNCGASSRHVSACRGTTPALNEHFMFLKGHPLFVSSKLLCRLELASFRTGLGPFFQPFFGFLGHGYLRYALMSCSFASKTWTPCGVCLCGVVCLARVHYALPELVPCNGHSCTLVPIVHWWWLSLSGGSCTCSENSCNGDNVNLYCGMWPCMYYSFILCGLIWYYVRLCVSFGSSLCLM